MKIIAHTKVSIKSTAGNGSLQHCERSGFALIAALGIMSFLVLLGVALFSLSSVNLAVSSQSMAQMKAKANAQVAMMIAVGELQEAMGPDKRISARADILDTDPATEIADGVVHPNYLGIWESWDTWLTDSKGSLDIQDTYQRGRDPSLFKKWLVSYPVSNSPSAPDPTISFPLATDSNATVGLDMVTLCGNGSAGPDTNDHVQAPKVEIESPEGINGSYAWWISDESQKARIDMPRRDTPGSISEAAVTSSHTGRMGIEKLPNMADFDTSAESLQKMVSVDQARISSTGVSENFHGLTTHSMGLLTDVRSGGFKSDINLAFESEVIPDQMDEAELFGGTPFDAPIRPMTGEIANIDPQNPYVAPMSWRQMREYYRVYREFSGDADKHPIEWNGDAPETKRFIMVNQPYKWDTAGYMRQPVMLRQNWVLATGSISTGPDPDDIEYHLYAIPVIYMWNPYNVAMRIESGEISYLGTMFSAVSLWHKVYRGETNITRYDNNDDGENLGGNSTQFGYRMRLTNGSGGGDIVFQPGEVRVFSTNSEIVNQTGGPHHGYRNYFDASPGYTPIQDLAGIRGIKTNIYSGNASQVATGDPLSIAIRLGDHSGGDGFYYGASDASAFVWHNHEVDFATQGAYNEDGSLVEHAIDAGFYEYQRVSYMGGTSVDWFPNGEINDAWIVPDTTSDRARWNGTPGGAPTPIGIFSITAKSAEQLEYDDASLTNANDFRNKTWLHAPPSRLNHFLMNPEDLNRADFPYQVHFRPVNGYTELSAYLQADGPRGYFGGGYTPSSGQTHISTHSLPIGPTTSLASFAGIRVDHATARIKQLEDSSAPGITVDTARGGAAYRNRGYYNYKHMAHPGGAFGLGIGNSYAHPMIDADGVYTRNDFGTDSAPNSTNIPVTDDYWDHLFLSNEELWDSWFCSSIAPEMNQGVVNKSKDTVAKDFFDGEPTRLPSHYQPYLGDQTPGDLENLAGTENAAVGENGWDLIAAHILNIGQFNVNSTSKAAWTALFMSLAERPVAADDEGNSASVVSGNAEVTLTRHQLSNAKQGGDGPMDENSWRGMRTLTDQQINKLAEEMVRQVKLRGPFLNMAEFINRRLTNDDTGVTGALQAAIDWDEFNDAYNGGTSGSGESINGEFKGSSDMITTLPTNDYPNEKAARGSRYAGIPGYVMQSDILQGIGNSISVRGDTFTIRAYGETLGKDGNVVAKAWCEAVIQRLPEYVNSTDEAGKKMRSADQLPSVTPALHPDNEKYGRRFEITSFRWLDQNEI